MSTKTDRLKEDLARISEEMGLPPGIGPAPGELRRLLGMTGELCAEIKSLQAFVGNEIYLSDYKTAGDMRAKIERLERKFPCGHRVLDWDNGYGECVACREKSVVSDYENLPLTVVQCHDEIERLKEFSQRILTYLTPDQRYMFLNPGTPDKETP